jgi:hypothetical protein
MSPSRRLLILHLDTAAQGNTGPIGRQMQIYNDGRGGL